MQEQKNTDMSELSIFDGRFTGDAFEEQSRDNGYTYWFVSRLMSLLGYESMASFREVRDTMIRIGNVAPENLIFQMKIKSLSYFLLALFSLGISACGQRSKPKENIVVSASEVDTVLKKTTIKFVDTEHDFGQVREGEKVVQVYEVLNTGKEDLVIQSVRPSCGCTTSKYDKKPIRPGKEGSIEVVFNTKGRIGNQHKTVLVVTNTEPPNTVLTFHGEVLPEEK